MISAYGDRCIYCEGSGMIVDPETPPPGVAYACRCAVGARVPKYIARWAKALVRVTPIASDLVRNQDAVNHPMKGF